jgi:GntR family transcriptional regulator, transcriptional repressor for pyruvate dehydrogenase complex
MPRTKDAPRAPQQDSRVTARLITTIKELISSGTIPPGGKFPPERELAKELKVNRASLRQVMKVLEIMGVLTQRVGDGTYLSASSELILKEPLEFMVLIDDISPSELFETRAIVEPELAARAALRSTSEDLAKLRQSIIDMERSRTIQERLDADMAFHEWIFSASGNRICHLLFRLIHKTVSKSMAQVVDRVQIEKPLAYHRKIYSAIRDRNADEARRQMLQHITEAGSVLNRSNSR